MTGRFQFWGFGLAIAAAVTVLLLQTPAAQQQSDYAPIFSIQVTGEIVPNPPVSGRLLVALAPKGERPNFTNCRPPLFPIAGVDVIDLTAEKTITIDRSCLVFPEKAWKTLTSGEYSVQAIFAYNRNINLPDAPDNLYSDPINVTFEREKTVVVDLKLNKKFTEKVPPNSATHKYLRIPSKVLSDFHNRPMEYRVAVILPEQFDKDESKKYGLLVIIGGFGQRYSDASGIKPDSQFVQILCDGAGPFGDPYQIDSANHGPYGAALTTEIIPYIEQTFRCHGTPNTRFTTGASTGGWVSAALQIYYPDFFNGCWSICPDSLSFERFQLIDLYNEKNAFVNPFGIDRPSSRTIDGDTITTVRREIQLERVLGHGGNWTLSGRDWASWNAVYGPKGPDGLPTAIWDGESGDINKEVLEHWKKFDLTHVLTSRWSTLGPKLAGKIHIWVGDSDDYFLNASVRRLKDKTEKLMDPKFDGTILIEARRGHEGGGWTREQKFKAMSERMGK